MLFKELDCETKTLWWCREPEPSKGPIPFHLVKALSRSFSQDHFVDDTGDVVYYQKDPNFWQKVCLHGTVFGLFSIYHLSSIICCNAITLSSTDDNVLSFGVTVCMHGSLYWCVPWNWHSVCINVLKTSMTLWGRPNDMSKLCLAGEAQL